MQRTKLFALLFAVAFSGCLCAKPSKGTKVGVITSLSDVGFICTTHEGTLVRGGLNNGSGGIGQTVTFNVADGKVLEQAQAALESGKEVEITFERPLISSICNREDPNDVTVTAITVKE